MRRTIIAFLISTIDVFRFDEDQMTTNGTVFKGEVPVTHLVFVFVFGFGKREERGTWALSAEVGAIVGGRGRGVGEGR
jgi:hypothetical protein